MEFNHLAILLTENCNAHCKMCCDSRGVVRGKTLTENELEKILNNIKECEQITDIGITGGEPMLYPHLIDQIMQFDFERDVKISIKTNGFWGKDISKAENIIKTYKSKLSYISLSYDEFHIPFIDIQCLKNIIMIAKSYNIPTDVVGCFLKNSLTPGDILNQLGESAFYTKFCYQPVIATGSGKSFPKDSYIKLLNSDDDVLKCVSCIEPDILINPKLKVYPCCSQVIENTLLQMGDLNESSLKEIILDIKHNYILNTIFTEGFTPFIKLLKDNGIEYPLELASPCEFCEFLFKDDWFLKLLASTNYYENLNK
ncbi:radical SAM protein [[Clostridium] innocuum]|uniref:radical SAM protein n=1 Tax=Clostridium innocuum TaxID=1522 RepID=UPI003256D820